MGNGDDSSITSVVNRLVTAGHGIAFHAQSANACKVELPSRVSCLKIMQQLRSILFPGYFCDTEE